MLSFQAFLYAQKARSKTVATRHRVRKNIEKFEEVRIVAKTAVMAEQETDQNELVVVAERP